VNKFRDTRPDYDHAICTCGWEIVKEKGPGVNFWWHSIPLGEKLPDDTPAHDPKPANGAETKEES
jgi:hypothetical protein